MKRERPLRKWKVAGSMTDPTVTENCSWHGAALDRCRGGATALKEMSRRCSRRNAGKSVAVRPMNSSKWLRAASSLGKIGSVRSIDITADRELMFDQLVGLLAREPDLFAKVANLFWGENSPNEASAVFKYCFRIVESAAFGTEHPILALRLRDPNEVPFRTLHT